MGPKKVNSKVEAANAKKAAAQSQKDAKKSQEQEADVAADWKKGANNRGAAKADAAAAKADEAARKKREKELLLAEEEEANSGIKTVKKQAGPKKGKKKKGSDLSFLEDSLTSAADKKAKEKKKKEKEKKEKEAQLALDRAAAAAGGDPDSLTGNGIVDVTDMIGKDDMLVENVNKPIEEEDSATGIEAGLSVFKFGKEEKDAHPEKRMKALHKAFEEKMLTQVKEDFPGLKLRQYQQKIFDMWVKSPENPRNQASK
ncbi:hypothetical protein TrLO_g4093 [Triparma laevis f. longispina]|uniref:Uncharacterized protein n=2 Tax=Triparma laevis TaxID=1534972 RepID=A0A9W7F940_9STRA|nr:hypothetical protein TrLO_g4093 [Triparma laevis f. longispina]